MLYLILSANSQSQEDNTEEPLSLSWLLFFALRASITINNFIHRTLWPSDLRIHYLVPHVFESLMPFEFSSTFSLLSQMPLFMLSVAYMLSITALCLCVLPKHAAFALAWLSYLTFWLPGSGLIQHGWAQLGADRYNYFPLAFGAIPALAYFLQHLVHGETENKQAGSSSAFSNSNSVTWFWWRSRVGKRWFVNVLVISSLVVFVSAMSSVSRNYLETWRNDKSLLQNCLAIDPSDHECHTYMSEYYGFFEHNDDLGIHHKKQVLLTMPATKSVKNLLFKARIILMMGGPREEVCALVDEAHALGPSKTKSHVFPMVLSNQLLCRLLLQGGMSDDFASSAVRILTPALATPNLPDYVRNGISSLLGAIEQWRADPNSNYDRNLFFLW